MDGQNNQISKIIANSLIKNQAIFLPSIGSLSVDSEPSTLDSSSGEITPPRYIVLFETQQKGRSIVELISQTGGVDTPQAESIYRAWLDQCVTPNGVNIKGIGTIANNKFSISQNLSNFLNPESLKALKLKRRRNNLVWITASVIIGVAIGLIANYSSKAYLNKTSSAKVVATASSVRPQVPQTDEMNRPAQIDQIDQTAQTSQADQANQTSQTDNLKSIAGDNKASSSSSSSTTSSTTTSTLSSTTQLECTTPPSANENPTYRVVYGVFSTAENAQKGAELAYNANNEVIAKVTPFGTKFMVSIFGTDDIAEAKSFIERNSSIYEELWIHKRRGE